MTRQLHDLRLLIVDDSASQREYAKALCAELGIHCLFEAVNGADAIAVLKEESIDVVLVDLEMPVMDGVDLIRSIATQQLAMSVVILSAKDPVLIASVGTMAEADGLHLLGTFHKPLQPDAFKCSLLRFVQEQKAPTGELSADEQDEVTALDLTEALAHHQLSLVYQPKLTVQGLLLRGVEALARWRHPSKGPISPGVFIPLAERHGMIDALTRHLLQQALQQKQRWQERGLKFHLAFNLSPLSLADASLVDWLLDITRRYHVEPGDLTLEVTENALLGELADAIQTLARLRLKGFHIAIDDYGTGFANAQQLSRVPATELKLDRSLVDKVASRPQQHTILSSTVSLAKNLGLTCVAEGVETLEDFQVLEVLGVDQVQGFYFSRPQTAEDLVDWLKTGLSQCRRGLLNSNQN